MDCEDSYAFVRQADRLLFHEGLGRILHRQRTEARRHGIIHEAWSSRIPGEEGVNGGGCWVEDVDAKQSGHLGMGHP